MKSTHKPTKLFWVITILALFWNIFGLFQFFVEMTLTEEMLAQYPQDIQNFMHHAPTWFICAFGIAVFAGALGSLALVLRRKLSQYLLLLSCLAVVAMTYYDFMVQKDVVINLEFGTMPVIVFVIAVLLLLFARNANSKQYLR